MELRDMVKLCQLMGLDVKNPLSRLTDKQCEAVKKRLLEDRRPPEIS
jgi:hypothetical protein